MTTETLVQNEVATRHENEAPAVSPLERVTNEIRRDSQKDADRYLEQTIVPHGGE